MTDSLLPCTCHSDDLEPYCPQHTPLPGDVPSRAASMTATSSGRPGGDLDAEMSRHASPMRCQFSGCKNDALSESAARGKVLTTDGELVEVNLHLCEDHRDLIARGVAAHVSLSVKATPARPA